MKLLEHLNIQYKIHSICKNDIGLAVSVGVEYYNTTLSRLVHKIPYMLIHHLYFTEQ